MTPEQNQLDVLINYKANFANATQSLNNYLIDVNNRIAKAEKDLIALSSKKSKVSTEAYSAGKAQLDLLYKEKAALQETLKLRDTIASQSSAMLKMNKIGLDNEIKGRKEVLSQLKEDILARAKISSDSMNQWRINTDAQIKSDEARSKTYAKTLKDRLLEDQKYANEQKKMQDRTWRGAWFGSDSGTTFGHKFLTTTQYAAAGTAIFAVVSAVTALATAALEADLNMRTMAAVLDLSVPAAKELDKSVRELGETYGGTVSEIEQVALALGRAGVATKDITKATEITLAMARLTGDTFEQSASAVISYQQVFGNTTSIQTLGDKLAYMANQSRLSTQDIGTLSNYALAAAKDVGLTEDAVGGLAAAFSNAGVNASTIGTQIRRFTSLLTDNSTAVTDFYRGIGVNQANLLASLKEGGATSNKAVLDFLKTLKAVDATKFTQLTGNMDILAANSLQLMRNNTENITKFITELQGGVKGQLENTKVILDSYIFSYQSAWNSLKNMFTDTASWAEKGLSPLSIMFTAATSSFEQAELKKLAWEQQISDKNILMYRKEFEAKALSLDELNQKELKYQQDKLAREEKAKKLSTKVEGPKQTNDELINSYNSIIDAQQKIIDNTKSSDAELEAAIKTQDLYNKKIKELTTITKQQAESSKINPLLNISGTDLQQQSNFIRSLVDAGKDTTTAMKNFNHEYDKLISKSNTEVQGQINTLSKVPEAFNAIKNAVNLTDSAATINNLNTLSAKLISDNEKLKGSSQETVKSNNEQLRVIEAILSITNDKVKLETLSENLATKQKTKQEASRKAEESAQRSREAAQRREESAATRAQNIQDAKLQAEAKYEEITKQILEMDEDSTSKAEQKFRIQTQLLGLAYDAYQAAIGTSQQEEKAKDYKIALAKYQEANYNFLLKEKDLQVARVNLLAQYKDGIDEITAREEYRLGLRMKERENDIEKLRMQAAQDYNAGKIGETEYNSLIQQIDKLEELSNKKKDIYTYAIEKQRELQDQETIGYNVAKAGITALENGMMGFFDVTSDGWLDWHNLATNILSDIYKQLLQQLLIKQLVSGIAGAISYGANNVSTAMTYGTNVGSQQTAMLQAQDAGFAKGGMIPAKGYASGGVLSGGTGIKDDIYLGNVGGTQMFAMGGEFITRKSSVNENTKGTLDYINKTGQVPNSGTAVNIPVKINIENQTGNGISADMIESMTKTNEKGEYEKVVNIILKASQTDSRVRAILKR